ncbi:hypothetical protein CXB51_016562 [Gossypium anomalum]|uniref:Metallo-beta-lactamase domain-containing protein n=1 Tax=Gossypium anomalum TaxID=47600 RepID=A0A8J5YM97_9ROSI|nr:hypothetical protein CXB51_016562 [Gossypium anomalum]
MQIPFNSISNKQEMQVSLPIVPSKIPSIFPFHHPIYPPYPPHKSLSFQTQASPFKSLKTSGYLSTISRAIDEEEEYRKARAAVTRKGIEVEGYFIEGLSIGGHETCVIVPELKSAFDIGRCPSRAIHQNFVFITHAHLDHIGGLCNVCSSSHSLYSLKYGLFENHCILARGGMPIYAASRVKVCSKFMYYYNLIWCLLAQGGLPMYVASRGLYNLKPPTVFVPPCIKEDVEKLLDIHRTMGQVELNLDLVALDVGETYELRNDIVVRPFRTHHVIPSQGYVVYSVRKKLKKQYIHLKGKQIEKLKKSGVEITDIVLSPEVAFTGDTTAEYMLDPRNADALRAKVLITEATFLDDGYSIDHARQHGHTHLSEIIENAQWIRNKAVLLTHFSSRYSIEVSI